MKLDLGISLTSLIVLNQGRGGGGSPASIWLDPASTATDAGIGEVVGLLKLVMGPRRPATFLLSASTVPADAEIGDAVGNLIGA